MTVGIGTSVVDHGITTWICFECVTFSFLRIDGCCYVIVFMACDDLQVRETCIWIQNGIDLFVRPTRSAATIYVVSNDMFRSTRLP